MNDPAAMSEEEAGSATLEEQRLPEPEQSRVGLVDGEVSEEERNDELLGASAELLDGAREPGEDDQLAPAAGGAPATRKATLGRRAVILALTQKGTREEGGGGNRNPYSRYFGYGPQAWCADFVSWAIDRCGNRDHKVPWGYPSGVRGITSWAKTQRRLKSTPASGDIFTYVNGGHTGLVVAVRGQRFTTIEGNTVGPDGKVIWVWSHVRDVNGPYHFVRTPE
jgi:hypothetical protein